MIRRRARPIYNPATDGTLSIWLDATDTALSSLQNTTGGTITNGATIGQWSSKAGTTRNFKQDAGGHTRPTWLSAGWMGLPAVRCNGHNGNPLQLYAEILTADNLTGFQNLSGCSVLVASYTVAPVDGGSGDNGASFTITVPHQTGIATTSMVYVGCSGGVVSGTHIWQVGGRRLQADGFVTIGGTGIPATFPSAGVTGGGFNYGLAQADSYFDGYEQVVPGQPFQTAGNTFNLPPYAMTIGGLSQEIADPIGRFPGSALNMDGYIGEILAWNIYKTPDQLVGPHDYLCYRWGAGKM